MLQARLSAALDRYEAMRATDSQHPPMSLLNDLTMLKTTMSQGCLEVAQQALAIVGFAGYSNAGPWSLSRQLRDLHSAPLMINNARINETLSNSLLLDPLNFGLV